MFRSFGGKWELLERGGVAGKYGQTARVEKHEGRRAGVLCRALGRRCRRQTGKGVAAARRRGVTDERGGPPRRRVIIFVIITVIIFMRANNKNRVGRDGRGGRHTEKKKIVPYKVDLILNGSIKHPL